MGVTYQGTIIINPSLNKKRNRHYCNDKRHSKDRTCPNIQTPISWTKMSMSPCIWLQTYHTNLFSKQYLPSHYQPHPISISYTFLFLFFYFSKTFMIVQIALEKVYFLRFPMSIDPTQTTTGKDFPVWSVDVAGVDLQWPCRIWPMTTILAVSLGISERRWSCPSMNTAPLFVLVRISGAQEAPEYWTLTCSLLWDKRPISTVQGHEALAPYT